MTRPKIRAGRWTRLTRQQKLDMVRIRIMDSWTDEHWADIEQRAQDMYTRLRELIN